MVEASYSMEANVNGYGGLSGDIGKLFCKSEYTAIGKLCIMWPAEEQDLHVVALQTCNDANATLYAPTDSIQNAVMVSLMKTQVLIQDYIQLHSFTSIIELFRILTQCGWMSQ